MERQTIAKVVCLVSLGLFLLSVVGCGGTITSLSKNEFEKKAKGMRPEEVIKWLGKPSRVANDKDEEADWHYQNACYDKITAKKYHACIHVGHTTALLSSPVEVISCEFSSD